jgi:N-acetylneuraminic acid mutarotase
MKTLNLLFTLILFFGLGLTLHAQNSWQQQTGVTPPARYGHSMVKIDNMVYVYGGVSTTSRNILNDLWQYNDTNGEWEELVPANPPAGKKFHAAAAMGGKMYVFMGKTATGLSQEIWEYDPQTITWTQKNNGGPQVPLPRSLHRATAGSDKIWISGGTLSEIFDDIWSYDVTTQQWVKGTSFEGARYGHITAYHEGTVIIHGGADHQGFLNDMQSYSISTQQWNNVQFTGTAPQNIKFAAFSHDNDVLWVSGGTSKDNNGNYPEVKATYEYNMATKQWTKKTDGPGTTMGTGAILNNNRSTEYKTFLFGGSRDGQALDEAWVYNSADDPLSSLQETGYNMPVNIYPTYTNGHINIKGTKLIQEIIVYNMQGQLILRQDVHDTRGSINLGKNQPGPYFIKIYSDKVYSGGKVMLIK